MQIKIIGAHNSSFTRCYNIPADIYDSDSEDLEKNGFASTF